MQGMKRSLFTKRKINAGDTIDFSTVEFKRPISGGLEVNYFEKITGKKFNKDHQMITRLNLKILINNEISSHRLLGKKFK